MLRTPSKVIELRLNKAFWGEKWCGFVDYRDSLSEYLNERCGNLLLLVRETRDDSVIFRPMQRSTWW